ncbi:histidine phosphatase family protein [Candidatus Uhrbacteria bacterium]|nr:histidine phosphatase family protein [Candidatus Uhrbacteria bacterium]
MNPARRKQKKNTGALVLLRHGESRFNELNVFTGWLDVPLTVKGIEEAHAAARHCKQFSYDAVFTSHLERAHETLLIALSYQKKTGVFQHESMKQYDISMHAQSLLEPITIPVFTSRALNERAYGDLQGMDKSAAVKKYGDDQVFKWRRGYMDCPPRGESLRDVYKRVMPYFQKMIVPRLQRSETLLMVGHGNALRALIKFMDKIRDDDISFVDLPFGHPLVYHYCKGAFERVEGEYDFTRKLR